MNIVRVVNPPALIERGRNVQYANRETLNARFLSQHITAEVRRRKKARKKVDPKDQDKTGGKLDIVTRSSFTTLWRRRRSYLPLGYFLGPQTGYDQGRLPVDTTDDSQKFTVPNLEIPLVPHPDPNPEGLGPIDLNTTFLIVNNQLTSAPRIITWGTPGSEVNGTSYRISAGLSYETSATNPLQPDSLDCTLESFVHLPSVAVRNSSVVNAPGYDSGFRITSYTSGLFMTGPHFYIRFSSDVGDQDITSLFPPGSTGALGGFYTGITGIGSNWNLYLRRLNSQNQWVTEVLPIGSGGAEKHFAVTYTNNLLTVYFDGQQLGQFSHAPASLLSPLFSANMFASSYITTFFLASESTISAAENSRPILDIPFRLSRMRLTFDSLYSGQSFTPPPTISGLL